MHPKTAICQPRWSRVSLQQDHVTMIGLSNSDSKQELPIQQVYFRSPKQTFFNYLLFFENFY